MFAFLLACSSETSDRADGWPVGTSDTGATCPEITCAPALALTYGYPPAPLRDGDTVIIEVGPAGGYSLTIGGVVDGTGPVLGVDGMMYDDARPEVTFDAFGPDFYAHEACSGTFDGFQIFLAWAGELSQRDYVCQLDATPLRLEVTVDFVGSEPDPCRSDPVRVEMTVLAAHGALPGYPCP